MKLSQEFMNPDLMAPLHLNLYRGPPPISDVPRYLFRAYSPGSAGLSDDCFICPAALIGVHSTTSLSQLEGKEARQMLKGHVLWENSADDILTSFTPSFLFALQHCVRKISVDYGKTTRNNCYICIIDTHAFPPGTFTSTVDLLKYYRLNQNDDYRLRHEWHQAEYLVQGGLDVWQKSMRVSFEALINTGAIFRLLPELEDPEHSRELHKRLEDLRFQLYRRSRNTCTTETDVQCAQQLAACFGGKWYLPMEIWGLSFASRPQWEHDPVFLQHFSIFDNGDSQEPLILTFTNFAPVMLSVPFYFSNGETILPSRLDEVHEWTRLMEAVHDIRMLCERPDEGAKPEAIVQEGPASDYQDTLDVLSDTFAGIHCK
jgi:hypothetical protein